MNKKPLVIIGTLVLIVVVALVAFVQFNKKSSVFTINVADTRAASWAPFYIALDRGFFTEEGLKINDVPLQTGDETMKALLAKSSDIALSGIIPYSFAALDNQNIKIFSQVVYNHDNQIIARKNAGISKPQDLKGKKIGYAKTTASDIGIQQFLTNWGIKESDVTLINLKPLAMPAALESGQIDAYSCWEPSIISGQKLLGNNAIVFNDEKSTYTWHSIIVANQDYINQNRIELKKFMAAMQKAEDFIISNPDESIAITAKYTNIPADLLKQVWNKYEFYIGLKDATTILTTDLNWANKQRANPTATIPDASNFINYSIIND
jgi:NitT/TauT family transport system substrate-binding protein